MKGRKLMCRLAGAFLCGWLAAAGMCLGQTGDGAENSDRTWTNREGKTIRGSVVRASETEVVLRLDNGRTYTIPLETLSKPDQSYVSSWRIAPAANNAAALPKSRPTAGFDAPWPKDVIAKATENVEVVEENADTESYIYRSDHFEFVADIRLSNTVIKEFSRIFEATYAALAALPLDHKLAPGRNRQHFRTRLFSDINDYYEAGGRVNTGGIYMGQSGEVLIPMSSLGLRVVGRRVTLDPKGINNTLMHELVHQLTALERRNAPTWYVEGSADYIASAPFRSGRFFFEDRAEKVVESVEHNMGGKDTFEIPSVAKMLDMGPREFYFGEDDTIMRRYRASLLLVTFFFHLDGRGHGEGIKAYLSALAEGERELKAREHLFAGRSMEKLTSDFVAAWKEADLELVFTPN
ncbi:MAG: hypothetical protein AAGA58_00435 [Verrucomicrobiota bacterium]